MLARLKIRSKRARKSWACFTLGAELVVLQGAIEPPDHPLGDLDGVALLVVGGDQLMDEPFGVDPASRVRADAKLARVIGNNHGVRQQALMVNAPHSAASLAMSTGSGATFIALRPNACK